MTFVISQPDMGSGEWDVEDYTGLVNNVFPTG